MKYATPQQKELWTTWKLDPQSSKYHENLSYSITSNVDIERLSQAFELLLNNHSGLRKVFPKQGLKLYQVITDSNSQLKQYQIDNISEKKQSEIIYQFIEQPFQLDISVPLRIGLFKVSPTTFILVIAFHHILFDGNCYADLRNIRICGSRLLASCSAIPKNSASK
jgi:NRPS condensation-like uncharacterized protein